MIMRDQINIRFIVLVVLTIAIGLWRVLTASVESSEWSTFSPLGALAMFGGAYFTKRSSSYLFPILILLLSDLILMNTIYAEYKSGFLYNSWYWTYGSFALMVWVGEKMKNRISVKNVAMGCLTSGVIHFLVSNFGVWLNGCVSVASGLIYPHTFSGMMGCYIQAIPYFKTFLIGNVVYSLFLFGGFELAQAKFEVLRLKTTEA